MKEVTKTDKKKQAAHTRLSFLGASIFFLMIIVVVGVVSKHFQPCQGLFTLCGAFTIHKSAT